MATAHQPETVQKSKGECQRDRPGARDAVFSDIGNVGNVGRPILPGGRPNHTTRGLHMTPTGAKQSAHSHHRAVAPTTYVTTHQPHYPAQCKKPSTGYQRAGRYQWRTSGRFANTRNTICHNRHSTKPRTNEDATSRPTSQGQRATARRQHHTPSRQKNHTYWRHPTDTSTLHLIMWYLHTSLWNAARICSAVRRRSQHFNATIPSCKPVSKKRLTRVQDYTCCSSL